MPLTPAPVPDYLVEREQKTGRVTDRITQSFRQWLLALITSVQAADKVLTVVRLTGQTASIGSTALTLPTLGAGTYRLTFYARITTAASINSSLTVAFGWTESSIALSASAAAITGNTTTTVQSASFTVDVDAATTLRYSTTYASTGTAMAYRVTVVAELIG